MSLQNQIKTHTGNTNPIENLVTGIVYKKTIGSYSVHVDGRMIACTLSSRLRKEFDYAPAGNPSQRRVVKNVREIDHVDPIAIGDVVRILAATDETGVIQEILPRRNRLSRKTAVPMPGAHAFEQVIVANIDQVVPVFAAANPPPRWNMLDRYLVAAEALNLPALICITKFDLVQDVAGVIDEEIMNEIRGYQKIGYRVIQVSAYSGQGLDELKRELHDRISVFVGKSGVGKSSLLNTIQPGLGLKVKEVSRVTGKGRHTTSHLEMFPLQVEGLKGAVVDTPGTREFGLWDIEEDDLALFFPEMRPYVGRCRFGLDCQHNEEPGCAIRKAVTAGDISPRRYQSFTRLKDDYE